MNKIQKISTRILVPAISATIIFSIALYFIADSIINRLVEQNLDHSAQSKVADIAISEKRIAGESGQRRFEGIRNRL
jgi:methyl-accepting chemotaxis protein